MTDQCSNQQPKTPYILSQPTGQDTATPLYSEEMVMLQEKKNTFKLLEKPHQTHADFTIALIISRAT